MPDRHRNSTKARRICYETHRKMDATGKYYMLCHCGRELRKSCGMVIDPVNDSWRAHHNIPWAEGGEDTASNLFPILTSCDVGVTAPEDAARIAKNQRIRDRRSGVKRPYRPMSGSRASPWKRTFASGWVRRKSRGPMDARDRTPTGNK